MEIFIKWKKKLFQVLLSFFSNFHDAFFRWIWLFKIKFVIVSKIVFFHSILLDLFVAIAFQFFNQNCLAAMKLFFFDKKIQFKEHYLYKTNRNVERKLSN